MKRSAPSSVARSSKRRPSRTTSQSRSPLPRGPLLLSALALLVENLARRLWPAASWGAVTLAALLSDVLPRLPEWLHLGVLIALLSVTAAMLTQGLRGWRPPTWTDARERLEAGAEGPRHRPWTAATDTLALGVEDPVTRALWARHQAIMAAHARRLRPAPPRPRLARRDPRALRVLALILLVVAGATAWDDPWTRLQRGITVQFGSPPSPVLAQVWVTPPAYTGRPPLYLQARPDGPDPAASDDAVSAAVAGLPALSPDPLAIPAGSSVLALVRGGRGPGHLDLGPDATVAVTTDSSKDPLVLSTGGDGSQRLEVTVDDGSRLRLTQNGRILIDRPLIVQPDRPPSIRFVQPPDTDKTGAIRLVFRVRDDHGVTAVQALVRPNGGQHLGAPLDLDLPPPPTSPKNGDIPQDVRRDLRAHPWAGTPVTVRLLARDARGQTAETEALPLVLPERRFTHPVAQAVVDMRRALVLAPHRADAVARSLSTLADDPSRYEDRLAVFLALKAAAARLTLAPDGRARAEDLPPLWSIALALEDGSLSLARQSLETAREALRQAIEDGAPAQEIAQRLSAVREALARLLESLSESLPLAQMPATAPMTQAGSTLSSDDIDRMLDDLAALSELGAEDAARALLDQLDQMLDQLQSARPPTEAELQAMAEMSEMARRLRDLAERQENLLDETFAQDPSGADGPPPPTTDDLLSRLLDNAPSIRPLPPNVRDQDDPSAFRWAPDESMPPPLSEDLRRLLEGAPSSDTADPPTSDTVPDPDPDDLLSGPTEVTRDLEARQQALRQTLESLMADLGDRLGQVPPSLGEADMAMRDAEDALAEGDTGTAARAQGRALEALRQGSQQAMASIASQMGLRTLGLGSMPGSRGGHPGMRRGPGRGWSQERDPLNRPTGGANDDDSVRLPTEPEARRARDILQELRRRANDGSRPKPERDYLDRLIEPF